MHDATTYVQQTFFECETVVCAQIVGICIHDFLDFLIANLTEVTSHPLQDFCVFA